VAAEEEEKKPSLWAQSTAWSRAVVKDSISWSARVVGISGELEEEGGGENGIKVADT